MSNEEIVIEQAAAELSPESAIEPIVVGDEQLMTLNEEVSAKSELIEPVLAESELTESEMIASELVSPEEGEDDSAQVNFADDEIKPLIESLLFAHGDPLSSKRLSEISKVDESVVDDILLELLEESKSPLRGVELVRVAEKYQYRTKGRFAPAIRELKAGKPKRLSGAALETLAVIAYRQPVVKSDIEKIRGVDVAPTLKTLLERSLVKIIGHQPTVGQPALYGTTDEFLKIFSLNSLSELPSLRDVAEFDFEPGESEEETFTEEPQALTQ